MGSFKSPCRNAQNRIRTHYDHSWSFSVHFLQSLRLVHQLHIGTLGIGSVFSTLGIIPSECWYIWCTLVHLTVRLLQSLRLRYNYFRFGKTNVRHIGILLPVSYHSSQHVILHQYVVVFWLHLSSGIDVSGTRIDFTESIKLVGAVAVWVASRPEACRLSQLQGCGFESAPLTSIA